MLRFQSCLLLLASMSSGCFLVHGRVDDSPSSTDAGVDASVLDANLTDAATVDLGVSTNCELLVTPRPAVQITTTNVEADVNSTTVFDNSAWVTWGATLNAHVHSTGRQLLLIDADSAIARQPSHQVMSISQDASYSRSSSVARRSDGQLAFIAWDALTGCRFETLSATGQVRTEPVRVVEDQCTALRATEAGYSFFADSGASEGGEVWLVHVDEHGALRSRSDAIEPLQLASIWWATAMDSDETYYVAGVSRREANYFVQVAHIDSAGQTLSTFDAVPIDTEFSGRIRLALFQDRVIVTWTQPTREDMPDGIDTLRAAAFSREGRLLSRSTDGLTTMARDASYSLVPVHGHLLAAYVTPTPRATPAIPQRIELLELDASGAVVGTARDLTRDYRNIRNPTLRETPNGAIVVFSGPPNAGLLRDVHALPIGCLRSADGDDGIVAH